MKQLLFSKVCAQIAGNPRQACAEYGCIENLLVYGLFPDFYKHQNKPSHRRARAICSGSLECPVKISAFYVTENGEECLRKNLQTVVNTVRSLNRLHKIQSDVHAVLETQQSVYSQYEAVKVQYLGSQATREQVARYLAAALYFSMAESQKLVEA